MTTTELSQDQSAALQTQRLAVKIFLESPTVDLDPFVNIFHRWIQQHLVAEHQPIDVADYKHVNAGPGIVLVTHEANIHLDISEGKAGLFYIRKQPLEGDFGQRLRKVLAYTARLAQMLEAEDAFSPRLKFSTDRLLVRFNDRFLAPVTAQTFSEAGPAVEKALSDVCGAAVQISRVDNPYRPFEIEAKLNNPGLAKLV